MHVSFTVASELEKRGGGGRHRRFFAGRGVGDKRRKINASASAVTS